MRSKNRTEPTNRTEPDPLSEATAPTAVERGPKEKKQTFIGPNMHFVGEIESWGSVRVEGQVEGKMTVGTLTVGRAGRVEGPVIADMVQIDGILEGDLDADTVVLGGESRVVGDITHRSLSMKPGACFEGKAISKASARPANSGQGDPPAGQPSPAPRTKPAGG